MASAFSFGTYIPAQSVVHACKAQVKLLLTCAFSIAVFFVNGPASGWLGLAVGWAVCVVLYVVAKVPLRSALRGLLPIAFLLGFTVLAHGFAFDVEASAALTAGRLGSLGLEGTWVLHGTCGFFADGLVEGLFFTLRVALLVAACSLLTFTSSVTELTDGLLWLLRPLRVLRLPVDDIAMMVSIALRFIPLTADEAFAIVSAQKARGAEFEGGSVWRRMTAWVPVLVPLIVRLYKRADDLAAAMDARSYACGPRTQMNESALTPHDKLVLFAGLVACVALGWCW